MHRQHENVAHEGQRKIHEPEECPEGPVAHPHGMADGVPIVPGSAEEVGFRFIQCAQGRTTGTHGEQAGRTGRTERSARGSAFESPQLPTPKIRVQVYGRGSVSAARSCSDQIRGFLIRRYPIDW